MKRLIIKSGQKLMWINDDINSCLFHIHIGAGPSARRWSYSLGEFWPSVPAHSSAAAARKAHHQGGPSIYSKFIHMNSNTTLATELANTFARACATGFCSSKILTDASSRAVDWCVLACSNAYALRLAVVDSSNLREGFKLALCPPRVGALRRLGAYRIWNPIHPKSLSPRPYPSTLCDLYHPCLLWDSRKLVAAPPEPNSTLCGRTLLAAR